MTDLPHVIAGDKLSDELTRIFEAYRRNYGMPWTGQRPTAAMYNTAIDWWNGLRPEEREGAAT